MTENGRTAGAPPSENSNGMFRVEAEIRASAASRQLESFVPILGSYAADFAGAITACGTAGVMRKVTPAPGGHKMSSSSLRSLGRTTDVMCALSRGWIGFVCIRRPSADICRKGLLAPGCSGRKSYKKAVAWQNEPCLLGVERLRRFSRSLRRAIVSGTVDQTFLTMAKMFPASVRSIPGFVAA